VWNEKKSGKYGVVLRLVSPEKQGSKKQKPTKHTKNKTNKPPNPEKQNYREKITDNHALIERLSPKEQATKRNAPDYPLGGPEKAQGIWKEGGIRHPTSIGIGRQPRKYFVLYGGGQERDTNHDVAGWDVK